MARILVVEDSPDIRALVRMLLEPGGHEVLTASDGREGVETARRERPDLVLMDLSLPVLSGWEATRQIKSDPATSSITVLAVTAHAMQGDRDRALAAGCDGFLSKPIDEETFENEVKSWLSRTQQEKIRSGAAVSPAAAPPDERGEQQGRILVVDDQPEVADLIRSDLLVDGHEVVNVSSLAEISPLFTQDSQFDLAVVDVMLGRDSGYELTGELIALSAEYLPVLLVTAGTIDRERGYAAGADDFIGKPIESAELRARARSLIRIGRAIREQGRAIKERSEAYEKLAELDRLKSDFLSTVSHELRTPLNTIILLSHVIEKQGTTPADEERRLHDVGVIRESAETLLRMINNILDLAKIEAGQRDLYPQRVELSSFLREMVDMLEPQARSKGIELRLEPSRELPDSARARQGEALARASEPSLQRRQEHEERPRRSARRAVAGVDRVRDRGHRQRDPGSSHRHGLRALPPDPHGLGGGGARHRAGAPDLQAARRGHGGRPPARQPRGAGDPSFLHPSQPGGAGRYGRPSRARDRRARTGRWESIPRAARGAFSSSRTTPPRATA